MNKIMHLPWAIIFLVVFTTCTLFAHATTYSDSISSPAVLIHTAHAQVPENVCSNYNNDSSNCHPPIEVQSPAYRAGVVQANYDWDHISRLHTCLGGVGYCPIRCPIGHSQDYCTAYTFGYRDQALYNENG